ncbi:MAG: hypothetical protein MZU91_07895 [Desulfosudis oleivorans]|nr:hypothetical protein [Desulfosudis oleivorans]
MYILITVAGMLLAVGAGLLRRQPDHRPDPAPDQGQPAGERGQPDPRTRAAGKRRDRRAAEHLPGDGGGRGAPARATSEARIIQSQKQASVGRLAAGVAHEINNPLTGVLTYTHMLLRRTDLAPEIRSDLQIIAEATERVRKIVKGLLDFSRQTKLDPEPTDINRLVAAAIALVEIPGPGERGRASSSTRGRTCPSSSWTAARSRACSSTSSSTPWTPPSPGGAIRVFTAAGLTGRDGRPEGRRNHDRRHGLRDSARKPRQALRTVLHDQGGRPGDRPGAGGVPGHRAAARRPHPGPERSRQGVAVFHLAAGRWKRAEHESAGG